MVLHISERTYVNSGRLKELRTTTMDALRAAEVDYACNDPAYRGLPLSTAMSKTGSHYGCK